jgi:hypothetical protein
MGSARNPEFCREAVETISDSRYDPVFQEPAPLNERVLVSCRSTETPPLGCAFLDVHFSHKVAPGWDGSITEGGMQAGETVQFSGRIIRRNGSNLPFRRWRDFRIPSVIKLAANLHSSSEVTP